MALSIFMLLKGNKKTGKSQAKLVATKHFRMQDYIGYIGLLVIIFLSPSFYSAMERMLLAIIFLPLSTLVFWELFKSITIPQLRLASVSLCVHAIFLMSQNNPIVQDENFPKKYHEISIGGYAGTNNMTHYNEDCDGNKYKDYRFKEKYYLMGAGYKYINEISDEKKLTLGIGLSYGKLTEHVENANNNYAVDLDYNYDQDLFAASPFVKYDLRRVGYGIGLLAGDISVFRGGYRPFTAFKRYNVLPQVHFRVGNLDKVWSEFNYGFRFPGISPADEYELLMGIKGKKGNSILFGTSAFHALVIRPEIKLSNTIRLEPYAEFFGPLFSGSYIDNSGIEGGLNLHYRIQN